jgi:hypothetical protein
MQPQFAGSLDNAKVTFPALLKGWRQKKNVWMHAANQKVSFEVNNDTLFKLRNLKNAKKN